MYGLLFLGCLFVVLFVIISFIVSVGGAVLRLLFGFPFSRRRPSGFSGRSASSRSGETHFSGQSGNAHHEGSRKNSRQRRSGKIFAQDEGTYVDFEEIKS